MIWAKTIIIVLAYPSRLCLINEFKENYEFGNNPCQLCFRTCVTIRGSPAQARHAASHHLSLSTPSLVPMKIKKLTHKGLVHGASKGFPEVVEKCNHGNHLMQSSVINNLVILNTTNDCYCQGNGPDCIYLFIFLTKRLGPKRKPCSKFQINLCVLWPHYV